MDTNSDPEGIDFPIPGNDDARRSIDLYCSLIKKTINNAIKQVPEQKSQEKKEISTEIKKPEMKNKVKKNIKKKPTIEIKTKDKKGKNK